MFGLEPTGDLTMIKAIQTEVKRLCNCDNIAGAIVDLDVMGRYKGNKQKYLANDDHENTGKNVSCSYPDIVSKAFYSKILLLQKFSAGLSESVPVCVAMGSQIPRQSYCHTHQAIESIFRVHYMLKHV